MFKGKTKIDRNLETAPYIIIDNFEQSSEKECIKVDTQNDKLYKGFVKRARKAEKEIEDSGLHMNLDVPVPPHPNNRDRYILWKKRNI